MREREREENYKSVKHERRHPKSDYGVAKRRTTPTKKKEKNFLIFPFCSPAPSSFPVLSLSLSLSLARAPFFPLRRERRGGKRHRRVARSRSRGAARGEKKRLSPFERALSQNLSRRDRKRDNARLPLSVLFHGQKKTCRGVKERKNFLTRISYRRTFSPFFLPFAPTFCVAARTVVFLLTVWTLVAAVTFVPTREVVNMIDFLLV